LPGIIWALFHLLQKEKCSKHFIDNNKKADARVSAFFILVIPKLLNDD
jgi:hypothetical protein